jgi:hypothetical protein
MLIQSVLGAPNRLSAVSANSMLLAIGALLWLMAVVGDAAHGVLMFPILKQHNGRIAVGYLAARIVDAIFIAIMVLFILIQIPLGSAYVKAAAVDASYLQVLGTLFTQAQLYAYEIGMSMLGISGLLLCSTLYKANLVPRWLAGWASTRQYSSRRSTSSRRLSVSQFARYADLEAPVLAAFPSVIVQLLGSRGKCIGN